VLAARFLPPGEVEDRAHALTGCANATVAHLMYSDEVLGLAFGRLREEVEQAIAVREPSFRVGIRFYLTNVHRRVVHISKPLRQKRCIAGVTIRGDPFLAFFARGAPGVVRYDAIISSIGG